MRRVFAAFAWIERQSHEGPRILTQWNRKWQAFNLTGGQREAGESFRECVVREIVEELGLGETQFDVSAEPLAQIEFSAYSVPIGETTAYTMALFRAVLADAAAVCLVDENPQNRWLSREELAAGTTSDGRQISEVALRFSAAINTDSPST